MTEGMTASRAEESGDRVRHYEILNEIDRGGMGVVYRGRDRKHGRDVAMKRPHPHLIAEPRARARFLREAKAASRIADPNVVRILETFDHEGTPWIVMELVEGQDLRKLLADQGRLPASRVVRLAIGLASGLKAAHAKRVLHRDIKPSNVLIAEEDRALLTDFGLARFLPDPSAHGGSTPSSLTASGLVVGTPNYMSPEQALGRDVDARSDVFSLGSLIYEMCTAAMPFESSGRGAVFDAIIHRPLEPMSRFAYDVPTELERIVRKSTAKRVDERYQNMTDLLVDLRTLERQLLHDSIAETITENGVRSTPWKRIAMWTALGLALIAGSVFLVARIVDNARPTMPAGRATRLTNTDLVETSPNLSPDGSKIAYVTGDVHTPDIFIMDVSTRQSIRLTDHPAADYSPAWYPDGSALVFVSDRDGTPGIWRTGQFGGSEIKLVSDGREPSVSPNGKQILFTRTDSSGFARVWVADLSEPRPPRMLVVGNTGLWDHSNPAWSPDGGRICYSDHDNLWVIPSRGGEAKRLTRNGHRDSHPAWSATGRYVYFSSLRGGLAALWRVDTSSLHVERMTTGGGGEVFPTLSRNASRIAYCTSEGRYEIAYRDLRHGTGGRLSDLNHAIMPAIAPDDMQVVTISDQQGGKFDLWVQSIAAHTAPRRLTDQPGGASHPAVSPDGRWIAYYSLGEARDLWIVPLHGGDPRRLTEGAGRNVHPAWSPDGQRLAFSSDRTGSPRIWVMPMTAGTPTAAPQVVTPDSVAAVAPAWSIDGTRIAFIGAFATGNDVGIVSEDGVAGVEQATRGAGAIRVRWGRAGKLDHLLVSGSWGADTLSLRTITTDGGIIARHPEVSFGSTSAEGFFDVSRPGNKLVWTRRQALGDLWLLQAESGSY